MKTRSQNNPPAEAPPAWRERVVDAALLVWVAAVLGVYYVSMGFVDLLAKILGMGP